MYLMETNIFLILTASLAGIINLLLGGFVLLRRRNHKINKILILQEIALAGWNFASLGVYFSLNVESALIWLKVYYISLVFLPSIFFQLVLTVIDDHRLITRRICQIKYFLSYIFLIISAMGMMSHDVNYIKGYYYPIGERGDLLFFVFFISAGIYSLLLLGDRRKTTNNILEKRQLQWLFAGGYINILGISSNLLCFESTNLYPLGHLATAIYPLIIGYAIVKHRLIPIETQKIESIGGKFTYLIVSVTIISLFLGGILSLEAIFRKIIGYNAIFPSLLIILILAILLQFIREKIQILIDKYFLRERYNQEEMVKEISRKIISIFDKELLIDIFLNSIINIMHIRNACVILIDETMQIAQVNRAIGIDIIKKKIIKFNTNSGLIQYLIQYHKPITKEKVNDRLGSQWREIKKDMEILNAVLCIPLTCKDNLLGVLILGEKMSLEPYGKEEVDILSILCREAGVALENANLYQEKMHNFLKSIQSLLAAVEAKDPYTYGHCGRVAEYSAKVASELGLTSEEIEATRIAAFLHDLGNIGVSDQILRKKGRLTIAEFENVKKHPSIGSRILEPICSKKEIIEGIKFHHERMDGSGYPEAINGTIPLMAKIIAVADVYDAMTSIRPYRKAFTSEDAISELKRGCGYEFDTKVVTTFIKVINKEFKSSRKR